MSLKQVSLRSCPSRSCNDHNAELSIRKTQTDEIRKWTKKWIEWYWPLQSEDIDYHSNIWKIRRALNEETIGQTREKYFIHEQNTPDMTLDWSYHQIMKSPVDIALIGSASFEWYMKCKITEVFITSLYEIDWIIKDKQLEEWQAEEMAK